MRKLSLVLAALVSMAPAAFVACGDDEPSGPPPPVEITSENARVVLSFEPFELTIYDQIGRASCRERV